MNFFQAQDNARRRTGLLVALFAAAVALTILLVYALVYFMLQSQGMAPPPAAAPRGLPLPIHPGLLADTAIGVLAVVSIGSLYKALALSGGGGQVAESMGGRLLLHCTRDPDERRLINIVEEMAIAAGAPMPDIYLMPDAGINAFAAGTAPANAVIGVTRGALRQLSRDQMQGVIAHEFSHIMNGDMRLNIRLVAVIHGIMLLGYIGYFLLRGSFYSSLASRRDGGGRAGIMLLAIGLIVAGAVGTFFGSWIRAAVSRQREYLADAAAVQYTRNPSGIAGALERIGQQAGLIGGGSRAAAAANFQPQKESNPHAVEYSHLFFSSALVSGFANPFATHPPLEKRIARIMPSWSEENPINTAAAPPPAPTAAPAPQQGGSAAYSSLAGGSGSGFSAAAVVEKIGTLNTAALSHAAALRAQIPPALAAATEDSYSARALIYAILMEKKDAAIRAAQLAHLEANADDGVYDATQRLQPEIDRLPPAALLPLVQLCLPPLRLLSPQQYRRFVDNMVALVAADNVLDLFEWCVQAIVIHALQAHFPRQRAPAFAGSAADAMRYALSTLVRIGQQQPEAAYAAACRQAGLSLAYDPAAFDPPRLLAAVQKLAALPPAKKQRFAQAAAHCAAYNGHIDANEAALLRAYFMIMDFPLPLDIEQPPPAAAPPC